MTKTKKLKWVYKPKMEKHHSSDNLFVIYDPDARGHDVYLYTAHTVGGMPFKKLQDAKTVAQLIAKG